MQPIFIFKFFKKMSSYILRTLTEVKILEDEKIIEMFFDRKEEAIKAASDKYGALCNTVSYNILRNSEDARECVNDALYKAWDTIPPNKPKTLSAYLAKIARNIALDRYRFSHRKKRDCLSEIYEESEDIFISANTVEQQTDGNALAEAISRFLHKLPAKKRKIFLYRYWLCEDTEDIAAKLGTNKNAIYTTLSLIRKDLKTYLNKEGFYVE